MRNLQKLLALVLALVMSLSLMAVANAADFTDVASNADHVEAIDVMTAIGVINGYTDGTFKPEGTLTRAEAAKIVAYMLLGDAVEDLPASNPFTDVPAKHWASAPIAYLKNEGIVNGRTATTFDPSADVNGYEFAKMLLIALGYQADQEGLTGKGYSINAAKLAATTGLNEDVTISKAALNRASAAQMAFNTLTADVVEYSGNTTVTTGDVTVSISGKANKVSLGSTEANNYANIAGDSTDPGYGYQQFCEKYFKDLKLGTTTADDFDRPGSKWTYKNGDPIGAPDDALLVYTKNVSEDDVKKDIKGHDFTATGSGATVTVNGDDMTTKVTTAKALADLTGRGRVVEIYTNSADEISKIIVINSYLAKVTKVNDDTDEITVGIYTTGNTVVTSAPTDKGYGTYKKDDMVLVAPEFDTNGTLVKSSTPEIYDINAATKLTDVEATSKKSDGTEITLGGTAYGVAANYAQGSDGVEAANVNLGTEYDAYLDTYGYLVWAKGAAGVSQDYIYVYSTYSETNKGDTSWYALGVLNDGTVTEMKITEESCKMINNKDSDPAVAGGKSAGPKKDVYLLYSYTMEDNVATLTYAADHSGSGAAAKYGHEVTLTEIKDSDKAFNDKHYLDSNVTFVVVSGGVDDLKADVYTGANSFSGVSDVAYVTTKEVDKDTNGTVSLVFMKGSKAEVSDDIIFVNSAEPNGSTRVDGKTYSTYEVYVNGEKKTITAKEAPSAGKFYTYSVDSNDIYTLSEYTTDVKANASVTNLYNGVLTADGLTNYDISNATIVDLTDNDITTASALEDLTDLTAKGVTVTVAAVYDDDAKTVSVLYIQSATTKVTYTSTTTLTLDDAKNKNLITKEGITAKVIRSEEPVATTVSNYDNRSGVITISTTLQNSDKVSFTLETDDGLIITTNEVTVSI